jgi:hypothetical protein
MDSNSKTTIICKIILYSGKSFELEVDSSITFSDLKLKIESEIDDIPGEINLLHNGRVIKDESDKISSLINNSTNNLLAFYVNFINVHGGCNPKKC